jgi:hypothetical protein
MEYFSGKTVSAALSLEPPTLVLARRKVDQPEQKESVS